MAEFSKNKKWLAIKHKWSMLHILTWLCFIYLWTYNHLAGSQARHTLYAMLWYQWRHRSSTKAANRSYWCQGINLPVYLTRYLVIPQLLWLQIFGVILLVIRVEHYILYAMLLSNCKSDATWNSYNWKVWFSQTYNYAFSDKLILCFQWQQISSRLREMYIFQQDTLKALSPVPCRPIKRGNWLL